MNLLLRRLSIFVTTALLAAILAIPAGAAVYLDLRADDPRLPAVSFVTEKGLLSGTSDNTFSPDAPLTRAMLCVVLSRMAGVTVDNAIATNLPDVQPGQWYTGAAVWALSNGLISPENGQLGANEPATRADLCVALLAYDQLMDNGLLPDTSHMIFLDLGGFDSEALHAIAVCAQVGLLAAREDGRFAPYDALTRVEAAEALQAYDALLPQTARLPGVAEPAWAAADAAGWTGELDMDFPLSATDFVSPELVNWLNSRILAENQPRRVSAFGTTLDGNPKHLTNYGEEGLHDCTGVTTILLNKNNGTPAGEYLAGRQEYYGYALQTSGITTQDVWHQEAMESGKDPWQCTWWAWGRAAQYLDLAYGLDFRDFCDGEDNFGNGGDYYHNLQDHFLADQTPSANSLISWRGGQYGHVAYVEAVDDFGIWVSAADSGHTWRGITYIMRTGSSANPYPLYWYSSGERLNGFIHLDYADDGSPIG